MFDSSTYSAITFPFNTIVSISSVSSSCVFPYSSFDSTLFVTFSVAIFLNTNDNLNSSFIVWFSSSISYVSSHVNTLFSYVHLSSYVDNSKSSSYGNVSFNVNFASPT